VHWARRAASRADCTAGKSKAIRTAMIAITTSNSMSVKPRRTRMDDLLRREMNEASHCAENTARNESISLKEETRKYRIEPAEGERGSNHLITQAHI
jgi:hypothetical protein